MQKSYEHEKNVAVKAGIWYVISSILVKTSNIITTPVFARLMTTEEYGKVATFISWHAMLMPICTMNLMYSIGRAKLDYPNKINDYIGSMQLFAALVTLGIAAVVFAVLEPIAGLLELSEWEVIILIVYLFFEPTILFYQSGYRYQYKYKQNIAIAWYTVVATSMLSFVLMIMLEGDMSLWRILGIVIPTAILSIALWIKSIKAGHVHCNKEYWKYGWNLSGPLILHTISLNILSQSDRVFISKICGTSDAGIYSLIYSYGLVLSILTGAVSDGWLPWFHDALYMQKGEEIRKKVKPLIGLGCYIGLACIALAPEAIYMLGGNQYVDGVNCAIPISLGIICKYIYTHYVNIEMHLKRTKYVAQGTIVAAILNIILNAVFIPIFGYIAAAYTTLVSYVVLLIIHFVITKKILKIHLYDDKFMIGALLATAGVSCVIGYSYHYDSLRYFLIGVGLISFIYLFRRYIFSGKQLIQQVFHRS